MARRTKADEMADVISPLAMDTLSWLTSIGVTLTLKQTVEFLQRFERTAAQLTAEGGQEGRNGVAP